MKWLLLISLTANASHIKLLKKKTKKSTPVQRIIAGNKKIHDLLQRKRNEPYIFERSDKKLTGSTHRGVLLNSIYSTNLASPVLVQVRDHEDRLNGSYFSCSGVTQHKRVQVYCNKLVHEDKEYQVKTQILNLDGSSGLIGEYYDGKEDLIAGTIISDFSRGVLRVAQSKSQVGVEAVVDPTSRNEIYQGLIESGETLSDVMTEEMKSVEPIVTINSGTEVLVFFMEEFRGV